MPVDDKILFDKAKRIRERAYAPYSRYLVGAVVQDENGSLHTGCNVENAAYPESMCAEASAIAAMIAAGGSKIVRIAVAGGFDEPEACTPCGGCRQKINEFATGQTRVVLLADDGQLVAHSLEDLLPGAFSL